MTVRRALLGTLAGLELTLPATLDRAMAITLEPSGADVPLERVRPRRRCERGGLSNAVPTFGDATVGARTFRVHKVVAETLPAAKGGDGAVRYTLTPEEPAGMRYTPPTGEERYGGVLSGALTEA